MGIRDRPSSARSPWQNGHAERLIGSIRRDCLDHVVVFGERHLRHLLNSYQSYYNEVRTHLSLQKDAPIPRAVRSAGRVIPVPLLGGLHHNMFAFEFPTGTALGAAFVMLPLMHFFIEPLSARVTTTLRVESNVHRA